MQATIVFPKEITADYLTFNKIIEQLNSLDVEKSDEVILDLSSTVWITAELCTFIGAVISILLSSKKIVMLQDPAPKVKKILQKNGFYEYYGLDTKLTDNFETTIPFRKFLIDDGSVMVEDIDSYLEENFFSKLEDLIHLDSIKTIEEDILEVAHNVLEHSKSNELFMCGQYYPRKELLTFTMADRGISIPSNVKKFLTKTKPSDVDCIAWSVKEGTSTKHVPYGGLGLFDLTSSLLKKGKVIIISGDGFWQMNSFGDIEKIQLTNKYEGTITYLEFNLKDFAESQVYNETTTTEFIF